MRTLTIDRTIRGHDRAAGAARLSAMATGSCLWLSVTVMSGSHVLFGSKIVSCSSAETFGNLLSRVQEEKFAERRVRQS